MRPNIFHYKNTKNEDHFTITFSYLLNLFPAEIGNRFLQRIATSSGKSSTHFGKFKEARFTGFEKDFVTSTSKPDMVIETSNDLLFFENKIDARLSSRQLERHLRDVKRRNGKLVFVSNSHTLISDQLLNNKRYVRPRARDHFIWADFESIFRFRTRRGTVAQTILDDFNRSLGSNGIKNRRILGAKDNLYTNGSDSEHITLTKLSTILKEIGFKSSKQRREHTLRVNLKKFGINPLLNPWLYPSGEKFYGAWTSECFIIDCQSLSSEKTIVSQISRLNRLKSMFPLLDVRTSHEKGVFHGRIYVPLEFANSSSTDLNWNHFRLIWEQIFNILSK